jgi:hypothetical protein
LSGMGGNAVGRPMEEMGGMMAVPMAAKKAGRTTMAVAGLEDL